MLIPDKDVTSSASYVTSHHNFPIRHSLSTCISLSIVFSWTRLCLISTIRFSTRHTCNKTHYSNARGHIYFVRLTRPHFSKFNFICILPIFWLYSYKVKPHGQLKHILSQVLPPYPQGILPHYLRSYTQRAKLLQQREGLHNRS